MRSLSAERTEFIARMAEECKRVEAVRVSVRTEVDGLRREVSELRKVRDDAVAVRKEQRSADLGRVERAVSRMFSSRQGSFRSVLEAISSGEVGAGPSDSSVEPLPVGSVEVVGQAYEAVE